MVFSLLRFIGLLALVLASITCGIRLPGGLTINPPIAFSGEPLPEPELRERIKLPPGFSIGVYASGVDGARFLLFTDSGDLLVSAPRQGKVFLIGRDADGDGRAPDARVAERPRSPARHGVPRRLAVAPKARRCCVSIRSGERHGQRRAAAHITGLPEGGNHWTRTVHVGPDDKLYVTVGSSCNACIEEDRRRAAMLRYELDGSGEELYATGLRNTVDFAWQPGTNNLYGTDNGRDLLGDDFPPCELNRIVPMGFYGWPFASGNRVPDPNYGAGHEAQIAASIPPVHGFGAHTAPLGMTYVARG
jgi:glucose/arabinose dehydrogenase